MSDSMSHIETFNSKYEYMPNIFNTDKMFPDDCVQALLCENDAQVHTSLNTICSIVANDVLPREKVALSEIELIQCALRIATYSHNHYAFRGNMFVYTLESDFDVHRIVLRVWFTDYTLNRVEGLVLPVQNFGLSGSMIFGSSLAKTQKVVGIRSLWLHATSKPNEILSKSRMTLIQSMRVLPYDKDMTALPTTIFLRPCPIRPRHGFVDSITTTSFLRIRTHFMEVRKIDPQGELIVMPKATAAFSIVLTPTMFSIGKGGAGATGGTALSIPMPRNEFVPASVSMLAGIADDEDPYLECVEHYNTIQNVQLRGGPRIESAALDFIPRAIPSIQYIIYAKPDLDLMSYEHACKTAIPNTVVYAPGLGMASHYAAHAYLHNIPYITTFHVGIGDRLEQNVEVDQRQKYEHLALAIKRQLNLPSFLAHCTGEPDSNITGSVCFSLLIAHLSLIMDKTNKKHADLIARGVVCFMSAYISALYGELRHYNNFNINVGFNRRIPRMTGMKTIIPKVAPLITRETVYTACFGHTLRSLFKGLPCVTTDFLSSVWNGSYGGPHWANATMAMELMVSELLGFLRVPTRHNWDQFSAVWHVCVNEQHNGGKVLTKYIGTADYDSAAETPAKLLMDDRVTKFIGAVLYQYPYLDSLEGGEDLDA